MKIKLRYVMLAVIAAILLVIAVKIFLLPSPNSGASGALSIGKYAPLYSFKLDNGTTTSTRAYQGSPLLLWFVATWCDTCAQGNQILASNLGFFEQHGVKIVELEQYDDLGQSGMPINQFIAEYGNNNTYVQGGYAGYNMTLAYNTPPNFQPDIFYVVSPSGEILYEGTGLPDQLNNIENAVIQNGI